MLGFVAIVHIYILFYLICENELLSKTILACLSGAQVASIHEIKKCQKISWHSPFKGII